MSSLVPLALALAQFGAPSTARLLPAAPQPEPAAVVLDWRPAVGSDGWELVATAPEGDLLAVAVDAAAHVWLPIAAVEGVTHGTHLDERGEPTHFAAVATWDGAPPRSELVVARRGGGSQPLELLSWSALVQAEGGPIAPARDRVRVGETVGSIEFDRAPTVQAHAGEPLRGLSPELLERFDAGRTEFDRAIGIRGGLGPAFNDQSCFGCHQGPASGGFSERRVTHFAKVSEPASDLRHVGGPVLQARGLGRVAEELLPIEAEVQADRITPHVFGAGLIEAVPDAQLEAIAAAQPPEQRGRVHWGEPLEGGGPRAGRFGWKSQFATLLSFSADALREELGQTSRLLPEENSPNGDFMAVAVTDRVPDPEIVPRPDGTNRLDQLVDFQRLLGPPPQAPAAGHPGEAVFRSVGCAVCHTPQIVLSDEAPEPFAGRAFAPFSDFLLHDLGGTGDGIPTGDAAPAEMRTAPLWGLLGRRFFWHDGTIARQAFGDLMDAAVERHGGQGAAAREAWRGLSGADRAAAHGFLESLGRHPHDLDGDGRVDGADGAAFADRVRSAGTLPSEWNVLWDWSGNGALEPGEIVAAVATLARAPERQRELSRRRR